MWVFLNSAFLSIVQDKDNMARLLVRARLRGDIERTFRFAEVIETPLADYRFRASIPRVVVSQRMQQAVSDIDYLNFKKSVPEKRRHDLYLKVWGEMSHAQEMQRIEEARADRVALERHGIYDTDRLVTPKDIDVPVTRKPGVPLIRSKPKKISQRGRKAARPRSSRPRK